MKKFISLLLIVVMCFSLVGTFAIADETAPTFAVECDDSKLAPGETFTAKIRIKNNPGITSAKLTVTFDESILVLNEAVINPGLGGIVSQSESKASGIVLNWVNANENVTADTFATLRFTVIPGVKDSAGNRIELSYDENDVFNTSYENVSFNVKALDYLVCSHEYVDRVDDAALVKAGNCVDQAVYFYSCVKCFDSEKDEGHTFLGAKDPDNHKELVNEVVDATYYYQGYKHSFCKYCTFDRYYDYEPILPLLTIAGASTAEKGDKLSFSVSTTNAPVGSRVVWIVTGASAAPNGNACSVTCDNAGQVSVTAKLVDADGKDITRGTPSASMTVTVTEPDPGSTNFFTRLVNHILGFFKKIFFCC